MHLLKFLIAIVVIMTLPGCASKKVEDYEGREPKLQLEEYFEGRTTAWGVFEDRFGKIRRQFVVDVKGTWDADTSTLKLVEDFQYDDGKTEQRIWTITKTGPNTYEGDAGGVVGKARGKTAGNAFNFKYTFDLDVGDDKWRVKFDDWMFLQDKHTLFNKATVSKFGLDLGYVYIFFRKDEAVGKKPEALKALQESAK